MRLFVFLSIMIVLACSSKSDSNAQTTVQTSESFSEYWYEGLAELNRYDLYQSRYGETHLGESVLIFVTEDFKEKDQVKYEFGPKEDIIPILKLNATKKFFTGIYPYSLMSSVFTPINIATKTLKVSSSLQEWCGHIYTQLNYKKSAYSVTSHSYFQQEGDDKYDVQSAILEDALWNKIRIKPAELPTGEQMLIPSVSDAQLHHYKIKPYLATLSITDLSKDNKNAKKYTIDYQDLDRKLEIVFDNEFPYTIMEWTETGRGGTITKAELTKQLKLDYWNKHFNKNSVWRDTLGLDASNY